MEAKDIAGALAGGVVAMEILDILVRKGFLTNADARGVMDSAIRAVRTGARTTDANTVITVLESIRKGRFPENG